MRTAVTLGTKHDGSEVLIAGRTVAIHEQKAAFHNRLGQHIDAAFKEVTYQESDGVPRIIHYISPDEAKARVEAEAKAKREWEAVEKEREARAKKDADEKEKAKAKTGSTWNAEDAMRKTATTKK